MTQKLIRLKKDYYTYLDRKARHIAYKLSKSKPVTKLILDYIQELYESTKLNNFENGKFESAYHNPISSDLEFLIARVLYHYSNFKRLDWKICLRRQKGEQKKTKKNKKSTAPDIRIEKSGKTLAIIEVKAKAGFIQPFFSNYSIEKYRCEGNPSKVKDCKERVKKQKGQLKKYSKSYGIKWNQVFIILPTLVHVHREIKTSSKTIKDYEKDFAKNSSLPRQNLILLSENLSLDLSSNNTSRIDYRPTNKFENFISLLNRRSK